MRIIEKTNISPGVVLLPVIGLIMFVISAVLLMVTDNTVSLYEGGVFGLLLIIGGLYLQIAGRARIRSANLEIPVLLPGMIVTITGYCACFIPTILGRIPQFLVLVLLIFGVVILISFLIQIRESSQRREHHDYRSINLFTAICGVTCTLAIMLALMIGMNIWWSPPLTTGFSVVVFLSLSMALLSLTIILQKVIQISFNSEIKPDNPYLTPDTVVGIQYGFYMFILGCLLIPVNLGLLPYSLNAMNGTLVVLFGVQVLVSGKMTTFTFRRTRFFFVAGMALVAGGTCAIIIQDTMVLPLAYVISVFIILGGLYLLYIIFRLNRNTEKPALKPKGKNLYLLLSLLFLAIVTAVLMIVFGLSMVITNLIPGMILAYILICFGISQFFLLYVLSLAKKKHLIPDIF